MKSTLEFKLALQKESMMLSARLAGPSEDRSGLITDPFPNLLFDVQAISSALLLQMRNVKMQTDGTAFDKGFGLCSRKGRRSEFEKALEEGLLCAVYIREDT